MKYLIILGDGMADEPLASLGNKTPLMVANTPNIDFLAKEGQTGRLITVPESMHPGSEIANMSVLGYDVERLYEGRGVLEAASMGVEIKDGDLAFRCNLICEEEGKIKNHSAGHISTEEGIELITFLNEQLGSEQVQFYPGVSYRHLMVVRNGNKKINCTPPHDVPGVSVKKVLPSALEETAAETAQLVNDLIARSRQILKDHPINKKRREEGKDPATAIWPWSPGNKPAMPSLKELVGVEKSAVISAVDLIKGIGVYAGMDVLSVEGATGLYDTNYEGKVEAALEALKDHDFVYLHIEASDEAGHEGDEQLKIKTIEYLDERVVKRVVEALPFFEGQLTVAVLPDHPTPCQIRTHTRTPVPVVIYSPDRKPDVVKEYNEEIVVSGSLGLMKGDEFIHQLVK